jgi:4-aminobutyrate--pyruvate transaminase
MTQTNVERDARFLVHGFTDLSRHRKLGPETVITGGKGIYVYDETGREYIEAVSGMWCTSLGFGEEALIEAAAAQMRKLPYYHTLAAKSSNPAIDLAERLARSAPIDDPRVYLALSGSEANDFLIKFLWYFNNASGRPRKKKVITRHNSYHGGTVVASSLTGIEKNHHGFDVPLPGFLRTHDPHYYRNGLPGESAEQYVDRIVGDLEQQIVAEGPDTVMAFMAEPVTGGGGVIIPPAGYWQKVQEVLARHDVFFLADEVITGVGRTGNLWGCDTFGIRPDTMTIAKGLSSAYQPIAALILSGRVYTGLERGSDQANYFGHGTTYSGHPVAAAVALEVLNLIEKRDLIAHVRRVGATFEQRLRAYEQHPLVGDVRSVGLMGAIELVADKPSKRMFEPVGTIAAKLRVRAEKEGVIVRACQCGDTIAFCPPLIITEAEVEEMFTRFDRALSAITDEVLKSRYRSDRRPVLA